MMYKKRKNGDKNALAFLLLNISPAMEYITQKYHLNKQDTEDVIQNATILIQKNIHQLKSNYAFKSWVSTILENECKKLLNEKKKQDYLMSSLKRDFKENIESASDENYSKFEDQSDFDSLISPLDKSDQIILKLFYQHHYTSKEIADTINIRENTVKSKLKRSRDKLKKLYEKGRRM